MPRQKVRTTVRTTVRKCFARPVGAASKNDLSLRGISYQARLRAPSTEKNLKSDIGPDAKFLKAITSQCVTAQIGWQATCNRKSKTGRRTETVQFQLGTMLTAARKYYRTMFRAAETKQIKLYDLLQHYEATSHPAHQYTFNKEQPGANNFSSA